MPHPKRDLGGENPVERLCRQVLCPDERDRVLDIELHEPTYPQRMAVIVPFWGGCPQGFPQVRWPERWRESPSVGALALRENGKVQWKRRMARTAVPKTRRAEG